MEREKVERRRRCENVELREQLRSRRRAAEAADADPYRPAIRVLRLPAVGVECHEGRHGRLNVGTEIGWLPGVGVVRFVPELPVARRAPSLAAGSFDDPSNEPGDGGSEDLRVGGVPVGDGVGEGGVAGVGKVGERLHRSLVRGERARHEVHVHIGRDAERGRHVDHGADVTERVAAVVGGHREGDRLAVRVGEPVTLPDQIELGRPHRRQRLHGRPHDRPGA